ncbi:MAG TPA: hypothetical protein VN643_20920 [Pyrinomonadaceae bacterium]|nr:hypothetical protein [Pyrinomonadaceae bacterium]
MEKSKRSLMLKDDQARLEALVREMIVGTHINVAQEVVITTEDKLLLILNQNLPKIGRRRDWLGPLACFAASIVPAFTPPFRDSAISNAVWVTLFAVFSVTSLVWLIFEIRRTRTTSPEDALTKEIIAQIKRGNIIRDLDPNWTPDGTDEASEHARSAENKIHDVM